MHFTENTFNSRRQKMGPFDIPYDPALDTDLDGTVDERDYATMYIREQEELEKERREEEDRDRIFGR